MLVVNEIIGRWTAMWKRRQTHVMWWTFPRKWGAILLAFVLSGAIYMMVVNERVSADEQAIPAMADGQKSVIEVDDWHILPSSRERLRLVMPAMTGYDNALHGWRDELQAWLYETVGFCTGVYPRDWVSVLAMQFPRRASTEVARMTEQAVVSPILARQGTGEVRVGIYHTHTAESFIPSSGKSHVAGGQCGEIVEVGSFLVDCLAKHGIKAVQSKAVHDYPNFMHAYSASEKTAEQMVAQYPTLDMIFDLHRDASKRGDASVTIGGKTCAKVLIIVAQGQDGLPQPHWQENYRLAKSLEQKMEELYPGLSGGIQLTEWRYNQHLHPHALLLEIGSHETSKGEAMRSAKMMAEVIAILLRG